MLVMGYYKCTVFIKNFLVCMFVYNFNAQYNVQIINGIKLLYVIRYNFIHMELNFSSVLIQNLSRLRS